MATTKHTIAFRIVTPEGPVYADEIYQVTVPTRDGEITVLANHTPLVSLLKPGELILRKEKGGKAREDVHLAVSEGFLEVKSGSEVVVLADTAERAEAIDLERADAARERAEKMLKEKQFETDIEHARLIAVLEKNLARAKIGRRNRRI